MFKCTIVTTLSVLLVGSSLLWGFYLLRSVRRRKIIPMDLSQYKGKIICQKDAFLAAAKGVSVGVEFQRKIGVGFFGGEGFIMQKLEGDGVAFVHAGGSIHRKTLQHGEVLRVDTGCLVAMTSDVDYNIETVGGVKTALFGGEGIIVNEIGRAHV